MHFNLPKIFGNLDVFRTAPPKMPAVGGRPVADALDHPNFAFYNPDALAYPDHNFAVPSDKHGLPGNGGYVTQGLGMVTYDHQATWQRERYDLAGPVRCFIRDIIRSSATISQ